MSLESVRAFFAEKAPDISVIESPISSATVALAAKYALPVAVVAGGKPKMLGLEEVADITGHEVGGVCPFGLKSPLPVYCDVSLKAFDVVVPAAGSTHSAVRITPDRMAELTGADWVDVCEVRP